MNVDLGDADGGVAIAISVIDDFLAELHRIGALPNSFVIQRDVGGTLADVTVLLNPPAFEIARPVAAPLYTRVLLTGIIEVRPAGQPNATPVVFPLNAAARLSIVLVPSTPVPAVGFRYDGPDGPPDPPVTGADIDAFFARPEVAQIISTTTIPLAQSLVEGLNNSRFPDPATRPNVATWTVALTLMPATGESVDAFAVTVGPPGTTAAPVAVESFVAPNMGLAVAYNRAFLDLMLARGATAKVGQVVAGATVKELEMAMSDTAIAVVKGHVARPVDTPVVDVLPDVDIHFHGPMVPSLVRGTTGMAFDVSGITVDIDDSDEVFFFLFRWFLTIGAGALLFTGWASLTALGILTWLTLVQMAWNGAAELDDAPNLIRDSLGTALGAQLSILAQSLDDDTAVGALRIDATPDSLVVVQGNMVLFAQVLVVPLMMRMASAEYSKKLRRFAIFELLDGRRFRAQELARLMKAGKVSVPGFHHVNGDYVRANPDDAEANNLLQRFKTNETKEAVVKNKR
jgi:hypothetical protein